MGKKVYEKRGKQTFYFQNKKKSHFFPSCAEIWIWEKMGKNVKKWGKKYMEREGKSIRFNKLLYIIIIVFCILNKIFRVP